MAQRDSKPPVDVDLYEELSRLNNELADMHREVAKKNTELKRLNDEKNRFLGMAAHDIRKPLSVISMYSGFLREELSGSITTQQQECIDVIREVGSNALAIVNAFLDISKIEAGRFDLNLAPADMVSIAAAVVRFNRMGAGKKHIDLRLTAADRPCAAVVDEQKIRQALDNLVCNAVTYSPENTTVTISVAGGHDTVTLAVSDQGPGIPPAEQDRIFAPYERTSIKSTGTDRGAGLGLAIAKKIVTAHLGTIAVDSTVGTGSTFIVTLPRQQPAQNAPPAHPETGTRKTCTGEEEPV